jgi:MoaA/NifB/PqqE/SkfB family radical SAM enzyme
MPNINSAQALQFVSRGIGNLIHKKPLALSLEITHACNCNCKHCDKGGKRPNEEQAPPERFAELVQSLKPLIAQISGGEPLLRNDVDDIIKRIKVWGKLPHMVFVTNAHLLTEEKYIELKELGIDEFSISLDYPDDRHDENRGIKGLYNHLENLIPKLTAHGNNDITMITVIRRDNLNDLPHCAERAVSWGANINFSTYTHLRTNDKSKSVRGKEDLDLLRKQLDYLIDFKYKTGKIFTTESVFNKYYEFFAKDSFIPDCKAGYRCLVVNPDGKLAPCAMQPYSYDTQKELVENFSKKNTCGGCLVSMRANSERSFGTLLKDSWISYKQMKNNTDKMT